MRKEYIYLLRGWCIEILRGYGLGPKLQRQLQRFLDKKAVITKAGRLYGNNFRIERGVTQRELISPTVFNKVVCEVVRVFLMEVCGLQELHYGIIWAYGEQKIVFYVDDRHIAGCKPIWVHKILPDVVRVFEIMGIHTNLGKTKEMVCTLGFVWGKQGIVVYKRRETGEGATFREHNKTRVSCE